AEQELLAGLAARIKRAGDLGAAEGAVRELAAVFAGERDALSDTLICYSHAPLGEPVDVPLAGPVIAALDRVLEEALHAVAVVLVVLRGVDAARRGDAVGAARAVVEEDAFDAIPLLAERGRGRG